MTAAWLLAWLLQTTCFVVLAALAVTAARLRRRRKRYGEDE